MTRDEAADKIARGNIEWGRQRDMPCRDGRGRIVTGDTEYRVMLAWAQKLPEDTFILHAQQYARAYWREHEEVVAPDPRAAGEGAVSEEEG